MNFAAFEALAAEASESVLAFAAFTERSEGLGHGAGESFARQQYESAWFELEIVNATALAEWDDDGKLSGCVQDRAVQWQALVGGCL